ncbi:kinase-like domain-containing protein [Geopyxis carbonaria]|nr:kinase-like domain-containing protein [Geopyxis carbonaria]
MPPTPPPPESAEAAPVLATPSELQAYFAATPSLPTLTACTRLTGGLGNYTFRATTTSGEPLVIKHAAPFVAADPSFALSVDRSYIEYTTLLALPALSTAVSTPAPLSHHRHGPALLLLPDLGAGPTLAAALRTGSGSAAPAVGAHLGTWLAALHAWGRSPPAAGLRATLAATRTAADVWWDVTYGRLVRGDAWGALVAPHQATVAAIAAAARARDGPGATVVHGDFWPGNVLLHAGGGGGAVVLDWELARLGRRWEDVAQMAAEMYLPVWFGGSQTAREVLRAFLAAYVEAAGGEGVDAEMARSAVVHVGVHLVCWPQLTGWGAAGDTGKCAEHGMEFVVRGWARDWEWVRGTVLAPLVAEEW